MTDLEYSTVQAAIQRIGVEMSAAECHGQLCGMLCSLPDLNYSQWLDMALPELVEARTMGDALAAESDSLLEQLFNDTQTGIVDRDLSFQPLIADDGDQLALRLEQLGEWSSGFLMGLAMGGIKEYKGLPGDIPEFMQDMVEVSRAGHFELENPEEDENAFMELVEYVRMGVMLVRMELHQLHSSDDEGHVSIH